MGIQGDFAVLVDTEQQGGVHKVPLDSLEKARFEKGPMSAKARSWTIEIPKKKVDLSRAIKQAVRKNAQAYLQPPFKGASFLGIDKMAKSLPSWLEMASAPKDLSLAALLMERAGTGGSIFRCFYRDFLEECAQHLDSDLIREAHQNFKGIAKDWKTVADLIAEAGATESALPLKSAAALCESLAIREKETMGLLSKIK